MPKYFFNAENNYLVAIVFIKNNGFIECKKYSYNIKDTTHYISKFCNDIKQKFPMAEYVNFYYKNSRNFKERINLE